MSVQFQQQKLSNGLTVLAESNDTAHTSAVGFFVKTGARDEHKQIMGVSHFLEHMMFKGTPTRTADQVNRQFDQMGANYNAYTTQELTAYYAQVLPEFLPDAIDLIGDMMRPALRSEDFAMEKNVILEEIGMYEDRPHWRLQDTIVETHFGEHPLSYRVLGTIESIRALSVGQMHEHFENCYGPDSITVAAAGHIDFDRLVCEVQRCAGHWPPTGYRRRLDEPHYEAREQTLSDARLTRHYLAMMCPGPSAQDERRYAAGILTDVLGDADGSRLYWALVDPGLADEADFSHDAHDCAGSFVAFASCDPARAEQVEDIMVKTIDRFVDTIDPDEIERAKNKIATAFTLAGENSAGRMRGLGQQWTYLNCYLPLEVELERIMAVDIKQIRQLIDTMPFSPRTIVRLGPRPQ